MKLVAERGIGQDFHNGVFERQTNSVTRRISHGVVQRLAEAVKNGIEAIQLIAQLFPLRLTVGNG
jgi:hypothetical protein